MPSRWRDILATLIFGVAFGYVEAAVVVYLRTLYYPGGFAFPLQDLPDDITRVEVAREVATIVMLAVVGWFAGRTWWGRFGAFAIAFGAWDLTFYGGLRVTLGWPATLGTWDILFLIPGIWTGPVWTPCLISLLLIACGALMVERGDAGRIARPRIWHWIAAGVAFVVIVRAFLANADLAWRGGTPEHFPAGLFLSGVAIGLAAFADVLRRRPAVR